MNFKSTNLCILVNIILLPMHNNSQNTGKEGEETAKNHLILIGYKILETNWRFKKLEIDIIARTEKTIVFVEVKARHTNSFGEPEVFVTKKKQAFLIAAANQYIQQNNLEMEARFDIIAITGANNKQTVKHLEGAFYPHIK
jgi:putative endonuclease